MDEVETKVGTGGRLYIRHAKKIHRNNRHRRFGLDPPIAKEERESNKLKLREIIKIYGIPEIIYCSPYLRTRQTMETLLDVMNDEERGNIRIIIDPDVGEYLGNQKEADLNLGLREETLSWGEIIKGENWDQLTERATKFDKKICEQHGDKKVCVITHGTFIQSISGIDEVDYLDNVWIPHSEEQ